MKRPFYIESDIHIRAYEIDAMGIVSNIVYVKWFEDLRHLMLDKYYPYTDMMGEKKSPLLMKTEIEYIRPLTIMDFPKGRLWFSKMGQTKWVIEIEIFFGDTLYCKGRQTGCFYDIANSKITAFPEWFMDEYKSQTADNQRL